MKCSCDDGISAITAVNYFVKRDNLPAKKIFVCPPYIRNHERLEGLSLKTKPVIK
jgi:hypothetical protein